ncbi:hypothetical protein SARC_11826, partial [Sphaeroforma arctica JP610]
VVGNTQSHSKGVSVGLDGPLFVPAYSGASAVLRYMRTVRWHDNRDSTGAGLLPTNGRSGGKGKTRRSDSEKGSIHRHTPKGTCPAESASLDTHANVSMELPYTPMEDRTRAVGLDVDVGSTDTLGSMRIAATLTQILDTCSKWDASVLSVTMATVDSYTRLASGKWETTGVELKSNLKSTLKPEPGSKQRAKTHRRHVSFNSQSDGPIDKMGQLGATTIKKSLSVAGDESGAENAQKEQRESACSDQGRTCGERQCCVESRAVAMATAVEAFDWLATLPPCIC